MINQPKPPNLFSSQHSHKNYEVDQPEIQHFLRLLAEPGQVVELRALGASEPGWKAPHVISGYFSDMGALAAAAAGLPYANGTYVTLNPVDADLLARCSNRVQGQNKSGGTTSDTNILRRRWLLVDLDAVRPSGISSSAAEHSHAITIARRVRDGLHDAGWPAGILADSGNGGHLLYRIDLPADDSSLVERVLSALALRYDDALAIVDQTLFNPSRICKLYGTWAHKGDDVPDRPHRLARILEVPDELMPVPMDLLETLAATVPTEPASPVRRNGSAGESFDLRAWMALHLPDAGPGASWQSKGGTATRWVLRKCPWNSDHTDGSAYVVQFASGAIAAGCHHNGCRGRNWQDLRNLLEPGRRERGPAIMERRSERTHGEAAPTTSAPPVRVVLPPTTLEPGSENLVTAQDLIEKLEALRPDKGKPERRQVEKMALSMVPALAGLAEIDCLNVLSCLTDLGVTQSFAKELKKAIRKQQPSHPLDANGSSTKPRSWPYDAWAGQMFFLSENTDAESGAVERNEDLIADFEARIRTEVVGEDGEVTYTVKGTTSGGKFFTCDIPARDIAEDRRLLAHLTAAAGPSAAVRFGMHGHLRPAIQLLSDESVPLVRRYNRTGWLGDGSFLIPGRESEGIVIALPRKLPYRIAADADLKLGLQALVALVKAMPLKRSAVALTVMFEAPLAHLVTWQFERYALFIAGRTGSLKTTWTQTAMALYGTEFLDDGMLVKWGEGATRNAIMSMAACANDLPFLIDNYKPNTGGGSNDFTNLIHNILEGGEKDRLNRNARLKEAKPVFCWPVITGEDVPDSDAASLARTLIVLFEWPKGHANEQLAEARRLTAHLSAVGWSWIEWLRTDAGQSAARAAAKMFERTRDRWAAQLRLNRSDMVNILRVATNLSTNQLTWWVMQQHPQIGPVVQEFTAEHAVGLAETAEQMASRTAESLEAVRFLAALRELLATGRCELLPRGSSAAEKGAQPDRVLGWRGVPGEGVFILPAIAFQIVEKLLGPGGLGGLSSKTLYSQLDSLGKLQSHDPGRHTLSLRIGDSTHRVLHLRADALSARGDDEVGMEETDGRE